MNETYLIWSEEHGAWWAPHGHSYTRSIESAGRFHKKRALEIVRQANVAVHPDSGINPRRGFNEILIVDPLS